MNRGNLYELYVVEKLPLEEIAKKFGTTRSNISYHAKRFGFPKRNKSPTQRTVGEQIGDWTLLRYFTDKRKHKGFWDCQCKCGVTQPVEVSSLNRGASRSCRSCAMEKTRDTRIVPAHYWLKLTLHAEKRKHLLLITHEYAEILLEKQGHRCALTGWNIGFGRGRTKDGRHSEGSTTASLDRVNSKIDYVEGNVQWVHKDINRMKQTFTEERLLVLCEAVLLHAKGEVEDVGSTEILAREDP